MVSYKQKSCLVRHNGLFTFLFFLRKKSTKTFSALAEIKIKKCSYPIQDRCIFGDKHYPLFYRPKHFLKFFNRMNFR